MGCFRSVNKLAQGRQIEMSAHAHSRSMMISLTWINGGLGGGFHWPNVLWWLWMQTHTRALLLLGLLELDLIILLIFKINS